MTTYFPQGYIRKLTVWEILCIYNRLIYYFRYISHRLAQKYFENVSSPNFKEVWHKFYLSLTVNKKNYFSSDFVKMEDHLNVKWTFWQNKSLFMFQFAFMQGILKKFKARFFSVENDLIAYFLAKRFQTLENIR